MPPTIALGARDKQQRADKLASCALTLTPEQAERIEAAGRPRPLYPFWHRAMWSFDGPTPSEWEYLAGHRQTVGA